MDALRRDDLRRAEAMSESERAQAALEAMRMGIRLKRVSLRTRYPHKSHEELDLMLRKWLARDE